MRTDHTTAGDGFALPNYTQIPNVLFDDLLPHLSLGELRVLLYLLRRTLGFHKDRDAVAISQLRDGTGLNRSTVVAAVRGLEAKRLILAERRTSDDHGHEANVYSVRFRDTPWLEKPTSPSRKSTTPLVAPSDPQKKPIQKKGMDPPAIVDEPDEAPPPRHEPPDLALRLLAAERPSAVPPRPRR